MRKALIGICWAIVGNVIFFAVQAAVSDPVEIDQPSTMPISVE